MKHFHLFKRIALACGLAATAAFVTSCATTSPASKRADQLREGTNVTIFSYNDASSPKHRLCTAAGPMPDNVARALDTWLRTSSVKNFNYAYPQYYIALTSPKGRQRVWGICTDGKANLVGILIPRDGVAAWDLPYIGSYRMYVCDTNQRRALSDAIMTYLAEAGYDTYRIDARKATGLTDEKYLISKPKTLQEVEAELAAAAAAKKAREEAAAAAKAAAAAAGDATGDEGEEDTSDDEEEEESSDDEEESSDEEETSDEEEESSDEEEEEEEEE